MSEIAYEGRNVLVADRPRWAAIWAGTFSFIAVWSVFAALGMAIFTSGATVNTLGIAIWSVLLTIIAMYAAGRITGRLAGIANVLDGVTHGIIMFGLSVAGVILLQQATTSAGATHVFTLWGGFSEIGWPLFVALFLGWLAAMGGASARAGVGRKAAIPIGSKQAAA